MNIQTVKTILTEYGLAPNKKLGQNFLVSEKIISQIVEVLHLTDGDSVLEIGPGLGALTHTIAELTKITVIEIDAGFALYLRKRFSAKSNVAVIHADFLKLQPVTGHTKLVSNLPYYCATEILFTLAREYTMTEIYVMLQKELGQRIVAKPGSKQYGALTITLGYYFEIRILFDIGKNFFYPKPDVNSSFLKFSRRAQLPLNNEAQSMFHLVVKSAFWGRRKTLFKALKESPHSAIPADVLEAVFLELAIDKTRRAEQISIEEFVTIAKAITEKVGRD